MTAAFNRGDEVYLRDGTKAAYFQLLDTGDHLVRPLRTTRTYLSSDDPDDYEDDIEPVGFEVVSEVNSDGGKQILSELTDQIAEKKKQLSDATHEVQTEIRSLKSELEREKDHVQRLMDDLGRYKGLEKIRDLFEGNITSAVYTGFNSHKVNSARMSEFVNSRHCHGFAINFNRTGDLNTGWKAKVRWDYSGEYEDAHVWLCSNDEEIDAALKVANERILASIWKDTLRRKPNGTATHWCIRDGELESYAKVLGEDNPTVATCRAWLNQHNEAKARLEKERKQADLAKLQAELGDDA